MTDITITKATNSDLEDLKRLNAGLFQYETQWIDSYNMDWTYSPAGHNYFLRRVTEDRGICLVAKDDTESIGYICGYVFEHAARLPALMAEVENIFVAKQYRSHGTGAKLIQEFIQKAKQQGACRVRVVGLSENNRATDFYHRQGFHDHEIVFEQDI